MVLFWYADRENSRIALRFGICFGLARRSGRRAGFRTIDDNRNIPDDNDEVYTHGRDDDSIGRALSIYLRRMGHAVTHVTAVSAARTWGI